MPEAGRGAEEMENNRLKAGQRVDRWLSGQEFPPRPHETMLATEPLPLSKPLSLLMLCQGAQAWGPITPRN